MLSKINRETADALGMNRKQEFRKNLKKRVSEFRQAPRPAIPPSSLTDDLRSKVSANGIWERSLGYLTDQKDICSAYNACPEFQEILKDKRVSVLLPEVIEILYKNGDLPLLSRKKKEDPLTFNKDVGNLRLVSKKMTQIANKIYFENPFEGNDWDLRFNYKDIPVQAIRIISKERQVDSIMEKFHQNFESMSETLLFRHLEIHEDVELTVGEKMAFRDKVAQLFNIIGDHVWSFKYVARESTPLQFSQVVVQFLRMMPNVKVIQLDNKAAPTNIREDGLDQGVTGFPHLVHLTIIEFSKNIPLQLITCAIKNNSQIKGIIAKGWGNIAPRLSSVMKDLQLTSFITDELNQDVICPHLFKMHWPLRKIKFNVAPVRYIARDSLFNMLEHFSGTLEELEMAMVVFLTGGKSIRFLDLPNLTKVEMNLSMKTSVIDFILPCKKLKSVRVFMRKRHVISQENGEELIQLRGFANKLTDSNLWSIFPMLEEIFLQDINDYGHKGTIIKSGKRSRGYLGSLKIEKA